METKINKELEQKINKFLNNASQHLFTSKLGQWESDKAYDDRLYKVISFKIKGNTSCITLKYNNKKITVSNIFHNIEGFVSNKNQLGLFKNNVFFQYEKYKAIKPPYKDPIKEIFLTLISDITKCVSNNDFSLEEFKLELNKFITNSNEYIELKLKSDSNDNK